MDSGLGSLVGGGGDREGGVVIVQKMYYILAPNYQKVDKF